MQPLRSKGKRSQVSRTATLPAPTAGWYVGDNQATPPPKTAVFLDNAFPEFDYVRVRGGSQSWAKGMPSTVSTLMPWTNGVVSSLFAVSNGNIYDVSSGGNVGAPVVTGLPPTSSSVQFTQFQGLAGTYLFCLPGSGSPHIFDGTGWDRTYNLTGTLTNASASVTSISSTSNLVVGMAVTGTGVPAGTTIAAIVSSTQITLSVVATATGAEALTFYVNAPITGYSGSGFTYAWSYEGRLYLVDGQTATVYYLGLAAIGGAATAFPLQAFFKEGGYVIAGGTWALDATSGAFLANAFISSEGEVLMYAGGYPGATNWNLIGQYKVARPVGPNCLMKAGGDLLIMTEDGIVAMSQVMKLDQVALENVAVTKPIQPAWRDAVIARAGKSGWQIVPWPLRTMAIVNLPKLTTNDYTQYVANTRTGAWARYLGWDANCFAVFHDSLFYGDSNGNVWQAETGGQDQGSTNYTTNIALGFMELDAPAVLKQIRAVKPYIQTTNPVNAQTSILVDYNLTLPQSPGPGNSFSGALWDVAIWDQAVWSGALAPQTVWVDAQGLGTAISVCYQLTTALGSITPDVRIASFDVLFEAGSIGIG